MKSRDIIPCKEKVSYILDNLFIQSLDKDFRQEEDETLGIDEILEMGFAILEEEDGQHDY